MQSSADQASQKPKGRIRVDNTAFKLYLSSGGGLCVFAIMGAVVLLAEAATQVGVQHVIGEGMYKHIQEAIWNSEVV